MGNPIVSVSGLNNYLNEVCHDIARWRVEQGADTRHRDPIVLSSRLMGIVSEVAECYQEIRAGRTAGLSEELADVFIRWAGLVGFLGIDIERAIRTKIEINLTEGRRGGGPLSQG